MQVHYRYYAIAQLKEELIILNDELKTRLQNKEDGDSLAEIKTNIRKIIQLIDLKVNVT